MSERFLKGTQAQSARAHDSFTQRYPGAERTRESERARKREKARERVSGWGSGGNAQWHPGKPNIAFARGALHPLRA